MLRPRSGEGLALVPWREFLHIEKILTRLQYVGRPASHGLNHLGQTTDKGEQEEHQRPGGAADCAAIWHPLLCGFSSVGIFSSPDLLAHPHFL
jgi:hypothetical protein